MATLTVARPDLFPNGTALSAYARPGKRYPLPGLTDAPNPGVTPAATATVSSDTAALTGLVDGADYVIVGQVGSEYHRLYMRTTEVSTGLAGSGSVPKWRTARAAAGLAS